MAGVAFHWHINLAAGVEDLAGVSLTARGGGVSQLEDILPKIGDIWHHTEDGRLPTPELPAVDILDHL